MPAACADATAQPLLIAPPSSYQVRALNPPEKSPLLRRLQAAPPLAILGLALLLIAGAGAADWYSGSDVAFTVIYLLPISLVAWFLGRVALTLVMVVCAATWLVVDIGSHAYARHATVEIINLILELGIFLSFALLLTSLRRRLELERELARTDMLTGLGNRRAFWDAAERELERCRRFREPFSIAYLDIDDFKGVNDRLGHRAGDELLQAVGSTLQKGIRRVDMAARLGGDEFALLLPGTDAAGAAVLLGKLRQQLTAGLQSTFRVGCSVGCLTVLDAPADVDEIVARADAVMYEVKRSSNSEVRVEVFPVPDGTAVAPPARRRRPRGDTAS